MSNPNPFLIRAGRFYSLEAVYEQEGVAQNLSDCSFSATLKDPLIDGDEGTPLNGSIRNAQRGEVQFQLSSLTTSTLCKGRYYTVAFEARKSDGELLPSADYTLLVV